MDDRRRVGWGKKKITQYPNLLNGHSLCLRMLQQKHDACSCYKHKKEEALDRKPLDHDACGVLQVPTSSLESGSDFNDWARYRVAREVFQDYNPATANPDPGIPLPNGF